MGIFNLFRRSAEKRDYTSLVLADRYAGIAGKRGLAELTGTVQSCVGLWESGLSIANTTEPMLSPATLQLIARSLAFRGEALFVIREDQLIPCSDWDVATRSGVPRSYRVTIPDTGGGTSDTVLAAECLHFRIGPSIDQPWRGTAPLQRASLTANLLHALEDALTDIYASAPLGSQIAPMPENPAIDNEALARSFRGQRGRVLLRESVNVGAAGGPAPVTDWKPSDLTPDLSKAMSKESLTAARDSICTVFGVLPSLLSPNTAGPGIREGQRHLAQWQLQPIANAIAAEASAKLGTQVAIDTMEPLQAYDAGGRARALSGVIRGMAEAKQAGLTDEQVTAAMKFAGIEQPSP